MKIQSQSRGTMIDRGRGYRRLGAVLEANSVKSPGPNDEEAHMVRCHLAGTWTQTWVCNKVDMQTKMLIRGRPLLSLEEN